jgi:hypothetical protein
LGVARSNPPLKVTLLGWCIEEGRPGVNVRPIDLTDGEPTAVRNGPSD